MTPFIPTSLHVNPLERLQANPGIYQSQLYFHKEVCIRYFGFFMKCSFNEQDGAQAIGEVKGERKQRL